MENDCDAGRGHSIDRDIARDRGSGCDRSSSLCSDRDNGSGVEGKRQSGQGS